MIIGLDVGGTHTDVALFSHEGFIREVKVPTNHADLFNTVLSGLEKITERISPQKIKRVVLSTTLTTNAIIEKKLPEVGMIVSGGPGIDPDLFRTNEHYFTISGSIDHRGREIKPFDKNEVLDIMHMLKQNKIKHVGIVGKFSARNPMHEVKIYEILKNDFEKVFMGHHCSGNLNFPRRIATTYLNTVTYPLHKSFFEAVKDSLKKKGLTVPIHILKADGGTVSFESSVNFPAQTILSGPAASVMGTIAYAPETEDAIVLDIGGTTTDMAVLIKQVPVLEPLGIDIKQIKTLIRSLKTKSIGIGGDSAVRIVNGEITLGPERKGPAMAYGGDVPTPTDALFVLGLIEDGDRQRALNGIGQIAKQLKVSEKEAAQQIFDACCQTILAAIRELVEDINSKPVYTIHDLQEGYQVKPKRIIVLGGPAPYFAKRLRNLSGLKVRIIPKWQVANAIGAALARTTCEVSLFADTERALVVAPEEKYRQPVRRDFFKEDGIQLANDLLRKKAFKTGAKAEDLEIETLEAMEFNMVRGFYTTGKNIRVKVQVKPGLIHGYGAITRKMYLDLKKESKAQGNPLARWFGKRE